MSIAVTLYHKLNPITVSELADAVSTAVPVGKPAQPAREPLDCRRSSGASDDVRMNAPPILLLSLDMLTQKIINMRLSGPGVPGDVRLNDWQVS